MAKRKKKDETVSVGNIAADDVLEAAVGAVSRKMETRNFISDSQDDIIWTLPVPSLAARYILQSEGLPLSRVYLVVGEKKSFKSTFLAEIIRWHRICGGFGIICEAETKPTPELRNSILDWDEKAVRVESCDWLEAWQAAATFYVGSLKKSLGEIGSGEPTLPVCLGVDSLMGKVSRITGEQIDTDGYASPRYAKEANLIKDYLAYFPQKIKRYPFTFVGINHIKPDITLVPGAPKMRIPGGRALRYHAATTLQLAKLRSVEKADRTEVTLKLSTMESSYGKDGLSVQVKLHMWYQNDAPEGSEPVYRLHSRFDWFEANTLLLLDGVGLTKKVWEQLKPKVKEIVDVHEKAAGSRGKLYWSNALGVPSSDPVSATELGYALELRPDLLDALYGVMHIARRPLFSEAYQHLAKSEVYDYLVAQGEANKAALARAQSL